MAAFTFVELRPMEGVQRALDPDVTIGREGCDVVLPDPEVSRRHAALRMTGDGPAVEDLDSSNGTWVNGKRIHGVHPLQEGDVVRFGNTEWGLREAVVDERDMPRVTEARNQTVTGVPARAPATEPGRRGDVPPPPAETPSAVHRVVAPQGAPAPPPFAPVAAMKSHGSAATRSGYTIFCIGLFATTAIALVLYFLFS